MKKKRVLNAKGYICIADSTHQHQLMPPGPPCKGWRVNFQHQKSAVFVSTTHFGCSETSRRNAHASESVADVKSLRHFGGNSLTAFSTGRRKTQLVSW